MVPVTSFGGNIEPLIDLMTPLRPYWGDLSATGAALLWAIAVILFQQAGREVKPLALNIYKNTVGILAVSLTMLCLGEALVPDLTARQWGTVAVSAILGITLGDVLLIAALNRIGAGMQAIVDCLYSPFIILLAYFFFAEVLPPMTLLGGSLILGALVVGMSDAKKRQIPPRDLAIGVTFGALSHLLMGIGILMLRELMQTESILWLTGARPLIAQTFLVIFFLAKYGAKDLFSSLFRHRRHGKLIIGSFLGTFLAILLWKAGFKWSLAGRAAIYNQLSSVFLVVLAVVILKEPLTRAKVLATVLGIAGALVVTWS